MSNGGRGFRYVPALDGVRALAVLAVLVFHADLGVMPGGFLGVSLFFTLSGFLITSLLLAEHEERNRIDVRGFVARRARRLLPAAHVCVLLVLVSGRWWGDAQRRDLPGDAIAAMLNVANWRFAFAGENYQDLFAGEPSPLAHFWSLAIEEQWYLVLPILVGATMHRRGVHDDLASRRGRTGGAVFSLVLLSIVATVLTLWLVGGDAGRDLVYHGTHTRGAELFMGALAATLLAGRRVPARAGAWMSGVGLSALVLCMAVLDLSTDALYGGGLVVISVLSAVAVAGLTSDHGVSQLLSGRVLVGIGKLSYGIYLYHWPVYLLLDEERVGVGGWLLLAVRWAVTLLVALASYRFVELPVRERRWPVRPGAIGLSLGGSFAVIAVAVLFVPSPSFSLTEQLLAEGDGGPVSFEPVPVEPAEPPVVLVLGSAVGAAAAVAGDDRTVVDALQPGCPLVAGTGVRTPSGTEVDTSTCRSFGDVWTGASSADPPDVVVLALGPLDAGIIRRLGDEGYPDPDDVPALAERLEASREGLRLALRTLVDSDASLVLFDGAATLGVGTGLTEIALEFGVGAAVVTTLPGLAVATDTVVEAVADGGGTASDALRVLVIGDSTSLDVARAMNDGSDGRLEVMWAGRNGCPFVRVEAARPDGRSEWSSTDCPPFDTVVPPLLESFRPDAVLLVVGPTELEQQRYPGDRTAYVAGDERFTEFHDQELAALLAIVGGLPVIVADAPPIVAGAWASEEMADPDRLAAWNAQVARWDERWPTVVTMPYAAALLEYEAVHGNIRADGVHPEVEALTDLARTVLVGMLLELVQLPTSTGG